MCSAIIEDTRTLAQVLGEASIGAMAFDDSATVSASMGALRLSPRATGIEGDGKLLVITETIKSDGATIGAISLRVDMAEVGAIVTDAIYSALGLVLIISLVAASLAYAVQLSIVRPVNNVVTLRKVRAI
jgi:methyl-accepting chemotaxis protein